MESLKNDRIDYFKYYYENNEVNNGRKKNYTYISNGVSSLGAPSLYRELMAEEAISSDEFDDYGIPRGNNCLLSFVEYYEKYIANAMDTNYFSNVCVTCGSSSAMYFVVDYIKREDEKKVLFVGLQYYGYEVLTNHFDLESYILTSEEKDRVLPEVDKIRKMVRDNGFKYLFLTIPMNPTGEMYSEQEFKEILKICVEEKAILVFDKCQMEEFEYNEYMFPYGKLIIEAGAIENVVIIDSFSKKRNVPALRIGYIAGNDDIMKYIEYKNFLTYYHQPMFAVLPILIDFYYRLIYSSKDNDEVKKIKKEVRKLLMKNISNKYAVKIMKYILDDDCTLKAQRFINEIHENYEIYIKNYELAMKLLTEKNYIVADRKGGFNFAFKNNNPINLSEKKFKEILKNQYNIYLFTQEDFGDKRNRDENDFWIRITCADNEEEFEGKLKALLNSLEEIQKEYVVAN